MRDLQALWWCNRISSLPRNLEAKASVLWNSHRPHRGKEYVGDRNLIRVVFAGTETVRLQDFRVRDGLLELALATSPRGIVFGITTAERLRC